MTSFRGMSCIDRIKLNVAVFEFNGIFVDGFFVIQKTRNFFLDVFLIARSLLLTPLFLFFL
jgi:hypothetical protein